ncbi:MAG TPA: DUF3426 domain-containing protein [Candidatus Cybelea sp.]|nr:DUF3426 domain-containing protein [Candidatus Cybelea sp.]
MILTCPDCATRYLIDPAALLPDGRRVRCAKCNATWREEPPADMPKLIEVEPPPQRVRPLPAGSNLPALAEPQRARSGALGWIALLVIIGGILAGGWYGRERIVAAWPPAGQLYAILGLNAQPVEKFGLVFRNIHSTTAVEAGVTVLVVSGDIVNTSGEVKPVPRLRVGLRNADRQEIYHWVFALDDSQIAPSGTLSFSTRLSSPPAEARDLQVTFVAAEGEKS